jgi:cellulose biosynthesis protein BcsQ
MIADFGDDSLLPIYFGPNRLRSGSLETFLSDDQTNYAPLHLYHDVETADEWSDVGRMLGHLSSQVLALGDNFDRVIVDLPGAAHKTRWPVFQASRTCLVVLAPDFHSVLGAKRLEEIRCQQQAEGRGGVTFYYVLNKFNPTRPFHLEIQRRLDQQLGDLLLPIYIQRSDDIPEALASGCTVFDYSPQAPVVEDFVRLAEWIGTLS